MPTNIEALIERCGLQYCFDSLKWHIAHIGSLEYATVRSTPLWQGGVGAIWRAEALSVINLEDCGLGDLEAMEIAANLAQSTGSEAAWTVSSASDAQIASSLRSKSAANQSRT